MEIAELSGPNCGITVLCYPGFFQLSSRHKFDCCTCTCTTQCLELALQVFNSVT